MSHIGSTVVIKGTIASQEDLVIDGRVEGPLLCEGQAVTINASGAVVGDIVARDITIHGRVQGQLVATDVVDVRGTATVSGHVMSQRFILNDEATFTGRAEPQHVDAAIRVARFNQQKREAERGVGALP